MRFTVEPLGSQRLEGFDGGNAELDSWLVRQARTATGHGTRTYVVVNDRFQVTGYFAVAPHLLQRDDAPKRLARGAPKEIPAILLAKLALDRSVQGQGLGAELLVHALGVIVDAARMAGGRVVVVDAIDDAATSFCVRHDFEPIPGNPRRLVMKLSTAARALGLDWP